LSVGSKKFDPYFHELFKAYKTLAEPIGKGVMDWRARKWCPSCGNPPQLEAKLISNPTLEIYVCPSCKRRFMFDTWTKAAKELERDVQALQ